MPYIYVFLRKDLPLADQIVQAAHATHQSGDKFGSPDNCHLVLFGVKNKAELNYAKHVCEEAQIEHIVFYEPDPTDDSEEPMGNTALCTKPIVGLKKVFKKFEIWKP